MTPTRLLLIRHAASTWNDERRWQGTADPPLSAGGEAQAAEAGGRLAASAAAFDAVVTSDLRRARRTADVLAAAIGWVGAIEVWAGLREYDVGDWSGLDRDTIETRWPGQIARWRSGELAATPGGEVRAAFDARVAATLAQLHAAHPDRRVLAISHGGVIGAVGRVTGHELRRVEHLAGCELGLARGGVAVTAAVNLLGGPVPGPLGADGEVRSEA